MWAVPLDRLPSHPISGLARVSNGANASREHGNGNGAHPQAERRRILVVDDEPGVRHYIKRMLLENGYAVHEARDGAEALDLVRAAPGFHELVVADIVMPRLNGIALVESLALVNPALPCILISGYAPPELAKFGLAAPCGVLLKPLDPDLFLREVERCLPQRN